MFGINVELFRWVSSQDSFVKRSLLASPKYKGAEGGDRFLETMLTIFGDTLGHDFQKAEEFVDEHWHSHPEIGPYPCLGLLAKYQSAGAFHVAFRDHVVHQLRVYILGLYIYSQCGDIQKALHAEIERDKDSRPKTRDASEEFLLRWLAAALSHDSGYVLENPLVQPEEGEVLEEVCWKDFRSKFEEVLNYPLYGPCRCPRERSTAFKDAHSDLSSYIPPDKKILSLEALTYLRRVDSQPGKAPSCEEKKAWEILNPAGATAKLHQDGKDEANLQKYYEFTRKYKTKYKENLPDHGVNSALMLLKSWYAYRNLLRCIEGKLEKNEEIPRLSLPYFDDLRNGKWWTKLDRNTIHSAAAATALHNIDLRRYQSGSGQTVWENNDFQTKLSIKLLGPTSQALAWLLRLCDSIQEWDRQHFKPLEPGKRLISSKDMSIWVDNSGVHLFFRDDPDKKLFNTLVDDLETGLDNESINKYVRWNDNQKDEFIEIEYPSWRNKGSLVEKSVPPTSKQHELVQAKVRATLAEGEQKIRDLAVCTSRADLVDCDVRLQLAHYAAESTRLGGDTYETAYVLKRFTILSYEGFTISRLVQFLSESKKDVAAFVRASFYRFALALSELVDFFREDTPPRRKYLKEIDPETRMIEFLNLRVICAESGFSQLPRLLLDFHGEIEKRQLDNILRELSTSKRLRDFVEDNPIFVLLERIGGSICSSLARVVELRGDDVCNNFEGSLTNKNVGDLGNYMSSRINELSHNSTGTLSPPIWKRDRKELEVGNI